jgi:hypothetical protein
MGAFLDRLAGLRHPLAYAIDLVGGMRRLGPRGTRRILVHHTAMGIAAGSGVGAVGGAGVEALGVIDPAIAQAVTAPVALEYVGTMVGLSALGGLLAGIHQISKAGQLEREGRRAAGRAGRRDAAAERSSEWLT